MNLLPSSREVELETLLRLRDTQLSELTDELAHLRRTVLSQPGPSTTEPVTLPPALVSVLSPHLHALSSVACGATTGSNTVNAALTQKVRLLQEENDELYDLLKSSETGRLKEEVRGLRRVVARLEGALRESHQAIASLSTELDKSYTSFLASNAPPRPSTSANTSSKSSITQSPRTTYHAALPAEQPPSGTSTNGPTPKLPPTGPRSYKKPRLSDAPSSGGGGGGAPQHHKSYGGRSSRGAGGGGGGGGGDTREYQSQQPPRQGRGAGSGKGAHGHGHGYGKTMDVDEDTAHSYHAHARPASAERERDRERERERDRERDRGGREREREGHGRHRRNAGGGRGNFGAGSGGGGGGGGGGRGARTSSGHEHGQQYQASSAPANDSAHGSDRTLRERMGL
ncbi:hypothetical protein H0H92_014480 [Tricholoma furcatifolium]|nr:hypothetical protein H0H92_014480 [Tricholoma furcatifolium]